MSSRHSITNVRRLVRGALGACSRAEIRYAKRHDVADRMEKITFALRALEFALGIALADAKRPRAPRHLRRVA